jgi:hypothetical protein
MAHGSVAIDVASLWGKVTRSGALPGTVLDVANIAAAWPQDLTGISQHEDVLMPIAGFLTTRTSADRLRADRRGGRAVRGPGFSATSTREWKAEIRRLVDDAAERHATKGPVKGLPALMEHFPLLTDVLDVLWPWGGTPSRPTSSPEPEAGDGAPAELPGLRAKQGGGILVRGAVGQRWSGPAGSPRAGPAE